MGVNGPMQHVVVLQQSCEASPVSSSFTIVKKDNSFQIKPTCPKLSFLPIPQPPSHEITSPRTYKKLTNHEKWPTQILMIPQESLNKTELSLDIVNFSLPQFLVQCHSFSIVNQSSKVFGIVTQFKAYLSRRLKRAFIINRNVSVVRRRCRRYNIFCPEPLGQIKSNLA